MAVTPEEVEQKVAAMAEEIILARWTFSFTMSQGWLSILEQAASTKTNLTNQLLNYSYRLENILQDYYLNVTSIGKFQ